VWVRYEPHVAPQGIEDDGELITSTIEAGEGAPPNLEQIEYERAPWIMCIGAILGIRKGALGKR
jgi:hypothetical protein